MNDVFMLKHVEFQHQNQQINAIGIPLGKIIKSLNNMIADVNKNKTEKDFDQ